jgi:signal peptide peptidase SppA
VSGERCASQLFGDWAILPAAHQSALETVKAFGDLAGVKAQSDALPQAPAYLLTPDGVAVLSIEGLMTKYRTSVQAIIGGTSTVQARSNLAQAKADPNAKVIVLRFDSPGGMVSGTADLADAVREASRVKPTYAFAEDLCCSAAYFVASQTLGIYANRMAQVGSLGTYTTMTDSSQKLAAEGVKVHVISTGPVKGAGEPGAPVTDAQLADAQRRVNELNGQFKASVARGRNLPASKVDELFDGRTWIASEAQARGLIDGVATLDAFLAAVAKDMQGQTAKAAAIPPAKQGVGKVLEFKATKPAEINLQDPAEFRRAAEALVERGEAKDILAAMRQLVRAYEARQRERERAESQARAAASPLGFDARNPEAFREAADRLVREGKAKDRTAALQALYRQWQDSDGPSAA